MQVSPERLIVSSPINATLEEDPSLDVSAAFTSALTIQLSPPTATSAWPIFRQVEDVLAEILETVVQSEEGYDLEDVDEEEEEAARRRFPRRIWLKDKACDTLGTFYEVTRLGPPIAI